MSRVKNLLLFIVIVLAPSAALACACGCGVFDVGTGSMLPTGPGGMAWLEYDFMNQDRNWHGNSGASSAENDDKNLKSQFFTAGAQYMFDSDWGVKATVPFTYRHFVSVDDDTGNLGRFNHGALGDVRLQGIYSGFSPDMGSGVTFGMKLPTGDYSNHGFDRDTAIGSGSTDLLLGAYHMGNLADSWNWFANAEVDQPVLITAGYRPGMEADVVAGAYYNGWVIGTTKIAPIAQLVGSYRLHDRGLNADTANSGYGRLLLAPGIEVDRGAYKLYADVGFPVYQHVRGNQLVASRYFTFNISRSF